MNSIEICGVVKRFGAVAAVEDVTLDIRRGEFFLLLGPSGCGKSTLLRLIAGLEGPTAGMIRINGQDVTAVPPHQRPVHMVFQHYALFPHLTVGQNVAFGLPYKGVAKKEHRQRVAKALALVRLPGLESRRPNQLSGGQRQRVALARALVLEPQVLLLDEPLGALDQKLRREMQIELKNLQKELGITFVFVTHDQEEAMIMSDRLAVMNAGRIEQAGASNIVFERPATEFVAQFMGATNFFAGRVEQVRGCIAQIILQNGVRAKVGCSEPMPQPAQVLRFIVRPEKLDLRAENTCSSDEVALPVTVEDCLYQGVSTLWSVRNEAGERFSIYQQNDRPLGQAEPLTVGRKAWMCWDWRHGVVLGEIDKATRRQGDKEKEKIADAYR